MNPTPRFILNVKELSCSYFPHSIPKSAVKQFYIWVNRNVSLRRELDELGFRPRQRTFTPRQAALVYHYLGEP